MAVLDGPDRRGRRRNRTWGTYPRRNGRPETDHTEHIEAPASCLAKCCHFRGCEGRCLGLIGMKAYKHEVHTNCSLLLSAGSAEMIETNIEPLVNVPERSNSVW